MKWWIRCLSLAVLVLVQACAISPLMRGAREVRDHRLFDDDWRFKAGEVDNGQRPDLADAGWDRVNLPHDFMIEGKGQWAPRPPRRGGTAGPNARPAPAQPTGPEMDGPFDRNSSGSAGNGYLNGGIGWYRKTFTLPESERGRRVFVEFEGVYMDSEVWLNGRSLGRRPYGYSTFQFELTAGLKYGAESNVLAVRVNVQQPSTRWYSGAGIYRHVWLTLTDPVHVTHWGTQVSTPVVSDSRAAVRMKTTIANQGQSAQAVELETVIRDRDGKTVASRTDRREIAGDGSLAFDQALDVGQPHRWSIEDPYLYQVESVVRVGGRAVDNARTPLGIRTFEFTVDKGFFLNGTRVPIQGVCNHHDQGPLGAAAYDRAIERQLEILKTMGCNAIRTSHNPPAPKLLELCDRMGFLVMDEAFDEWLRSKTTFGYGRFFNEWSERDMKDMVLRDRNHPSVILWSIGNEIPEQSGPNAEAMAARLAGFCRELDPTRPVTSGMNNPQPALQSGFAKALDVLGINYHIPVYAEIRGIGKLVGSETSSDLSSRGEYLLEIQDGRVQMVRRRNNQVTAYNTDAPDWGNTVEEQFKALRESPWIAGEFVWTGFDYIGEPTPYNWPSRSSYFGIIDLCGFPKDRFYLYQSQWTDKPMVHLFPHWNWPDTFKGKAIPVWCYTNADAVELFLNGKSMGVRDWDGTDDFHFEWDVPYEPGTLKAVARKGGKVVATDEVVTAGPPARIQLKADRTRLQAGQQDLSYVTAEIVDAQGRLCPNAEQQITFKVRGRGGNVDGGGIGAIVGVGNGDPTNHEPFNGDRHKAFHGLCLAIVRAANQTGTMTVEASADGLAPARVDLAVR